MQITIEDLSPVEKKVEFELPWAEVAPKLDKAYDSLRRGVRLPGFRPGKVPRAMLERMYRRQVEDEVARELVERSLGQAIQENQIQPVAPPAVAEIEIKTGAPFKFSARVEVRSQVTPKDYAGIEVNRRPPVVTDEQVAEALEGYRRRLTQFKPVDSRKETGDADLVRAEISGKVGEHKIKRRELMVDLEDDVGGPLPGLASRLRGKPIGGEPVEVDYTLPAEGPPPELAGRHVHLHVTIKEARQKQVPAAQALMPDARYASGFGTASHWAWEHLGSLSDVCYQDFSAFASNSSPVAPKPNSECRAGNPSGSHF